MHQKKISQCGGDDFDLQQAPSNSQTFWLRVGRAGLVPAFILAAGLLATGMWQAEADEPKTPCGPAKVEIRKTDGRFQLYVDHKPFCIKGAGLEFGSQEKLAEHGANSFRTWGTRNGREILDRALKNGLYVTLGLSVAGERSGFDYSDKAAVARQFDHVKAEVMKYKDHPALLIWAIGNELNMSAHNPRVWDAVNDLSKMIHEIDTNHLTTTPLAGMNRDVVRELKARAPDLDLLSFQVYGDLMNLPLRLREAEWDGPYLITEWGATGHWEVKKTDWGAPIEDDSTTKANLYLKRFEAGIASDHTQCVGSYVFLWGQKQERTPTWFGMFLESGEETAAVDTMHYLWKGAWPAERSPRLEGAWLDGKTGYQSIHLKSGQTYAAKVLASAAGQAPLSYSWELLRESTNLKRGGDFETKPQSLSGLIEAPKQGKIVLKAPAPPGAYRLFAYVYAGKGHAAHVNIPFYVDDPAGNFLKTASH